MKLLKRSAFTLIELLVVITIIGILATGATAIYTSQIQKSRDATRLTDVDALRAGIEQFYQDANEYPSKGGASFSGVTTYVPKLPQDPKSAKASANSIFDYLYNVSADANTIPNQEYEVSTHFEQQGNITGKAVKDGGEDNYRLELGVLVDNAAHRTDVDLDSGIPNATAKYTCLTQAGANGNCSNAADPMLVRN